MFDFKSSMALVKKYAISLPSHKLSNNIDGSVESLPSWLATKEYHYFGGKVQAGGRGFLGFQKLDVFDPDSRILETKSFRQDFPYIGRTHKIQRFALNAAQSFSQAVSVPGFSESTPCWTDKQCQPVIPEKKTGAFLHLDTQWIAWQQQIVWHRAPKH